MMGEYETILKRVFRELKESDHRFKGLLLMYEDVYGPLTVYRKTWFGLVADPIAQLLVVEGKPTLSVVNDNYRDVVTQLIEACEKTKPAFSLR